MKGKRTIVVILCMLCLLGGAGCLNNEIKDLMDYENIKLGSSKTQTGVLIKEESVNTNQEMEAFYSSYEVEVFESRGDQSLLLEKMENKYWLTKTQENTEDAVISIDDDIIFQEFYGYGAALTHSAASNI